MTARAVSNPVGRAESTALLLAAGLSAVPLLLLYRTELIGYDAFWHVFVARQDVWSNFWQEVGARPYARHPAAIARGRKVLNHET